MFAEVLAGAYGPQCFPLTARNSNLPTASQNTSNDYCCSADGGKYFGLTGPFGTNGNSMVNPLPNSARLSAVDNSGNCNLPVDTRGRVGQASLPTLQTLYTHTPAPSDVSSIAPRSAHSFRSGELTPAMSVSSNHERVSIHSHGSLQTPSSMGDSHKQFQGGDLSNRKHVFLQPAVPRHQDWQHYKTLPSAPSSTMDGSDNDSQSIVVPSSATSHYHTGTNLSPYQGNEMSPFPSRFTSPTHSANINSRPNKKRALSISPSLSEGLDLTYIIRLSPTSLASYLVSRNSSTSGSPQPGQQGSFSHLSARNTSPYPQNGSGQRRTGGNFTPFSMGPSESNILDDIMNNSYVAPQSDMPFIEYNCSLGNYPSGINMNIVQNGHMSHNQRYSNMPGENEMVSSFAACSMQSSCMMANNMGIITSGVNGDIHANMNTGLPVNGIPPPPSYNEALEQQHHHHHQQHSQHLSPHRHPHQQHQIQHSQLVRPDHVNRHHPQQLQQQQQQLHMRSGMHDMSENLQVLSPGLSPCLQVLSPGVQLSPGGMQGLNTVGMSPAASSMTSSCMSPMYAPDSSSQLTSGMTKQEDCEEDDPNICRWIDCGAMFKEQEDLVKHIEKAHIDQRKVDEFTCYWQGCSRQFRSFNARYKLLIHMRVHSGEKPNKCMVIFHLYTKACTVIFHLYANKCTVIFHLYTKMHSNLPFT